MLHFPSRFLSGMPGFSSMNRAYSFHHWLPLALRNGDAAKTLDFADSNKRSQFSVRPLLYT